MRAHDYTQLCELLDDARTNKNEVSECTENKERDNSLNVGSLVVMPLIYIGSDRYARQKMHDVIAISNSVGHPDIFITMNSNPYWL